MYEFEYEPFINKDKRYMTDEEWIKHLEHWIRELKKKIHNLKQEKAELKAENKELKKKLEHYENTMAIQKSNDASRWKPWCMIDKGLSRYFSL